MFTGIIKDVGTVKNVARRGNGLRLTIEFQSEQFDDLSVDESISLSGACQTVVAVHGKTFEVDTVEETLKKTTLGSWRVGTKVNLERAVRASDRMGGHYVQSSVSSRQVGCAKSGLMSSSSLTSCPWAQLPSMALASP